MSASEIPSTFRVYARQWAWEGMLPTQEKATDVAVTFAGRLHPEDIDVREHLWVQSSGETHTMGWTLWLRRWSPLAEATTPELAERLAEELSEREDVTEVRVVARNSAEEHELTRYGTVKLPASGSSKQVTP